MNLEFSKSFVKGSLWAAALAGAITYTLLWGKFFKLAEASVTPLYIKFGAVGVAACLLILVIFSFLKDGTLATIFRKNVMAILSFFSAMGFSALAASMVYYSDYGWSSSLKLYLALSLVFWANSLLLLYIITNVPFPRNHRIIVCSLAFIALIILGFCVYDARNKGLL